MAKLVSSTYSEALFEAAIEENILEAIKEEFDFVISVYKEYPELYELLNTPKIAIGEKKESVTQVFSEKVSDHMLNFLKILLDKKRTTQLENIKHDFDKLYDNHFGIEEAIVKSATELSKEQIASIKKELDALTGKNIRIKTRIDVNLVGGLYIKIGDRVLDGSIQKRLIDLKDNLKQIIV